MSTLSAVSTDNLHLYLSATGIGDAICGLYAACGAADARRVPNPEATVCLHTEHTGWLKRVRHPGLEVCFNVPVDPEEDWIDVSRDYAEQLRCATSRKQWYADNIEPGLTPRPPAFVDTAIYGERPVEAPYVILAPFSHWASRHWPNSHWNYLAALLHDAGYYCLILDGPGDGSRLNEAFAGIHPDWGRWQWGNSPEWVGNAILSAEAVIGIDSGMTHYAALLGAPTVTVMAHLPPELVFSHTQVRALSPQTACTFCRWQPERGFRSVCDAMCSAMATIAPERVWHTITEIVRPQP